MNFEQGRLIMNSSTICHSSFFTVVWMFHRQKLNVHINRLHERALRVIYKCFDSSSEELLRKDSSTTLHRRILQQQMNEIFKVKTGIAPKMMKGVFGFASVPCNMRNQSECNHSISSTGRYGIETASSVQNYGKKFLQK